MFVRAVSPSRSGEIVISLSLPADGAAQLDLFDVAGRRVERHEVGALGPGYHELRLASGSRLRAGVYMLRLTQGSKTAKAKVAVLP